MTTRSFADIRERLEAERDRLRESIQAREEEVTQQSDRERNDFAGYSNHMADGGTATFEMEKDLALVRNAQALLTDVDQALARMNDGTYGTCERCGKPIPIERLEAFPQATFCVPCKTQREHGRL